MVDRSRIFLFSCYYKKGAKISSLFCVCLTTDEDSARSTGCQHFEHSGNHMVETRKRRPKRQAAVEQSETVEVTPVKKQRSTRNATPQKATRKKAEASPGAAAGAGAAGASTVEASAPEEEEGEEGEGQERGGAPLSPVSSPSSSPSRQLSVVKAPQSILKKRPRSRGKRKKGLSWRDTSGSPICDYSDPPAHNPFLIWKVWYGDDDNDDDDDDDSSDDEMWDEDEDDSEEDEESEDEENEDEAGEEATEEEEMDDEEERRERRRRRSRRRHASRKQIEKMRMLRFRRLSTVVVAGIAVVVACIYM